MGIVIVGIIWRGDHARLGLHQASTAGPRLSFVGGQETTHRTRAIALKRDQHPVAHAGDHSGAAVGVAEAHQLWRGIVRPCVDRQRVVDADAVVRGALHLDLRDVEVDPAAWLCLNDPAALNAMWVVGRPAW